MGAGEADDEGGGAHHNMAQELEPAMPPHLQWPRSVTYTDIVESCRTDGGRIRRREVTDAAPDSVSLGINRSFRGWR